ncbi:MAG: sodium:solute symporter family protein [Lachnospiraceae bacterium]|nr:sodium:solute symporter family protein [Lachnospiraceae bacterium]
MSNSKIFLGVFVVYCVGLMIAGWYASSREKMSGTGYFRGGNSNLFVFLFGTLSSIYSSWMFIGNPALLGRNGLAAGGWLIQVPLIGMCIHLLWNKEYMLVKKYNFKTTGELMGNFFESKFIRTIVAIIACLYCIPYICAQMKGAGAIVSTLSQGELSSDWGIYIIAGVTLVYMLLGGMKGTAITSAIQGFLLVCGFYGLAIFILKESSWSAMWSNLASMGPEYITTPGVHGGYGWSYTLTYALVCSFGIICAPTYTMWIATCGKGFFQRSRRTAWIAWTLVCGFTYMVTMFVVGCGGLVLAPNIENMDNLVPTVMLEYFPLAIFCLVGVAAIASAQSTASTSLQAATSAVTEDLIEGVIGKQMTEKEKLWWGRGVTLVFLIISMLMSNQFSSMIAILGSVGVSFGFMLMPAWVTCMFSPVFSKEGVASGIVAGSAVLTYLYVTSSPLNSVIHFGFAGLIVNVVVASAVSAFTKKPSVDKVWQFHGYLRKRLSPEDAVEVCGRSTAEIAE